ncbi:hypothetical protein KIN20_007386 [Parelaphostrongylus tenuis]|uniref:Uncharacterized protein n=1 Tax=Parelaphostrongylus tenuis TaxID=148309 RepID=A0AAD5MP35_PARTN|nr:hypothetical protein KIN20_007386 [Parelaphostrongylus tenuis]
MVHLKEVELHETWPDSPSDLFYSPYYHVVVVDFLPTNFVVHPSTEFCLRGANKQDDAYPSEYNQQYPMQQYAPQSYPQNQGYPPSQGYPLNQGYPSNQGYPQPDYGQKGYPQAYPSNPTY